MWSLGWKGWIWRCTPTWWRREASVMAPSAARRLAEGLPISPRLYPIPFFRLVCGWNTGLFWYVSLKLIHRTDDGVARSGFVWFGCVSDAGKLIFKLTAKCSRFWNCSRLGDFFKGCGCCCCSPFPCLYMDLFQWGLGCGVDSGREFCDAWLTRICGMLPNEGGTYKVVFFLVGSAL